MLHSYTHTYRVQLDQLHNAPPYPSIYIGRVEACNLDLFTLPSFNPFRPISGSLVPLNMAGGGFFSRQVLFMSLLVNIALLAYISHHLTTTGPPTAYIVPEEYQRPVFVAHPDEDAAALSTPAGMTPLVSSITRCGMCDVAPELCAEIGKEKMDRAVSYFGSNKRLRRVLRKMRTGEPWVMGVIGGSGLSMSSL